jgi:hypothetical protein
MDDSYAWGSDRADAPSPTFGFDLRERRGILLQRLPCALELRLGRRDPPA